MSDRLFELKQEALFWSDGKYATDKSGYDREYWYAQRLAHLVVEECISLFDKYAILTLENKKLLRDHFEME